MEWIFSSTFNSVSYKNFSAASGKLLPLSGSHIDKGSFTKEIVCSETSASSTELQADPDKTGFISLTAIFPFSQVLKSRFFINPFVAQTFPAFAFHFDFLSSSLRILNRSMAAKKIVLKLAIEDENGKKKALKKVAGVQGVDSVAVDMKENKITVIGDVDPVCLASKLRKYCFTDLLSVGPAKEEKKEGEKKGEGQGKKENKTEAPKVEIVVRDEYPNTCVIC